MKAIVAAKYLTDLTNSGFFNYVNKHGDPLVVEITLKGMQAFTSDYFWNKQRKLFWNRAMNISITIANVAVAITAIIALLKSDSQTEALKERLTKVEQVVKKTEQLKPQTKSTSQPLRQTKNSDSLRYDSLKTGRQY